MSRGEDVSGEKKRIIELMASGESYRRRFGWASLQIAFPDVAKHIEGFDPESPSPAHVQEMNRLLG